MARVRQLERPVEPVATDPVMSRVVALCHKAATSPLPVLLEGEHGTGKTAFARLIHDRSDRAARPFVVLDCAATAWDRIEPALFGSGLAGSAPQPGKLHEARGGTLLLKEIGELPVTAQSRLLAFLETSRPAPGARAERLDVRLIATSSRRLLGATRAGDFDEKLYYRLGVLPITLPPLRDRPADLAPLVERFMAQTAAETGRATLTIGTDALDLLRRHDWPANVRELENAVYRAAALAPTHRLGAADFPHVLARAEGRAAVAAAPGPVSAPVHLDAATAVHRSLGIADRFLTPEGELVPLAGLERDLIAFALARHGGQMSRIARALGIGRSTLYRKLRDYGLDGRVSPDAA